MLECKKLSPEMGLFECIISDDYNKQFDINKGEQINIICFTKCLYSVKNRLADKELFICHCTAHHTDAFCSGLYTVLCVYIIDAAESINRDTYALTYFL